MASISREPNGRRTVQFVGADGKRRSIRLGKASERMAQGVKVRVEALVTAQITGHPVDDDTSRWLTERDTVLIGKLSQAGLVPKRESATLAAFIDSYVDSRTDVKPATKEIWRQGRLGLVGFFGADRRLRDITPGDADGYKLSLIGQGLAPMTVRKRLQFATTVFRSAVRHKLISEDPFAGVKVQAVMPDRMYFVSPEDTAKMLEACPGLDWRLIVALSRYGGLRCPSEVLSLRLDAIDWAADRMRVDSPKTEHHAGKGCRVVALFPELRAILREAFEAAPEGAVYVVDEKHRKASMGKAGWRNCNLRTTMEKIIRRAGLTPWPRLFHNLRSSRETELAERFPMHVVAAWLGHTETIAQKHYLQVTDQHFAAAVQAVQNPVQQPSGDPGKCWQSLIGAETGPDRIPLATPARARGCKRLPGYAVQSQVVGTKGLADGEGFEPPVDLRPQQFSRLPP